MVKSASGYTLFCRQIGNCYYEQLSWKLKRIGNCHSKLRIEIVAKQGNEESRREERGV